MACLTIIFLQLTVLLIWGATRQDIGNFPLSDCQTGQFDIVMLQTIGMTYSSFHTSLPQSVIDTWIQDKNRSQSRVLVSRLIDTLAVRGNTCNLNLTRSDEVVTDLCNSLKYDNLNSSSLHADIEMKIKMATTILSDMGVGRQNSTHVAVIIHDSSNFPNLTNDEVRKIPDILQEHSSEMKVIIIIHDFGTEVEAIFLRDTIIAGRYLSRQKVSMALCMQCLPGWFQREHKETGDLLSCYKLHVSPTNIDWFQAMSACTEEGQHLATVESKEELEFLQQQLLGHLTANRQLIYDARDSTWESVEVHIGLKRESKSFAKRFQWTLKRPNRYRPLVLNHWLPGNPVQGFIHACGVWFYSDIFKKIPAYNHTFENVSENITQYTEKVPTTLEGWSSAGCGSKLTPVSLCEVTFSRLLKGQEMISLDPPSKPSYDRALRSGDFQEFDGHIVSVTAYVNDKAFLNFMKAKNKDFPVFDCGEDATDSRYVSYYNVFDSVKHCSNGQDELIDPSNICFLCAIIPVYDFCFDKRFCKHECKEEDCENCIGRRCCDGTCLPPHLFNDGEIDCSNCRTIDGSFVNDETRRQEEYTARNETCSFTCNINECVYPSQLNDGSVDCTGPEGPLDETIGKLEKANSCSDVLGRPIWAPRCVYLKDRYGSVLGCRDLSHLQNCSDFPCQEGYYKCPGSYCIPLHYVMDGKSDCPSGEEERHIVNYTCVGNFLCWNTSVCLHSDLVCDGTADCPHKDDEMNCGGSCIDGLICLAGSVTVDINNPLVQLDNIAFLTDQTRYLDLSGVDLSGMVPSDQNCVYFVYVKMSGCKIIYTNYSFPLSDCCMYNVYGLDLSFNLIVSVSHKYRYFEWFSLHTLNLSYNTQLEDFVDVGMNGLVILDLSHTGLSYLDITSFHELPKLKHLNLSHTRLSTFHTDIFPTPFTLETLDLRGSPIVNFFQNTYNGLIITSSLYTDNFGLCCPQVRGTSVPEYKCHASDDVISSCFDLIAIDIQQILIWLMAGIALSGNLVVILYRLIWDRLVLEKAYGLFVLNLGISDLIMGLYLLMIAAADVYYRDVYVLYDKEWRESVVCKLAGFLATLSSETSTFFVFFITVDRLLTLKYPYGQIKFSRMTKLLVISLTWGISFLLALIPVMPVFGNNSILTSTAMCNSLLVTNQRVSGWEYSLSVFIVLNFIVFLFTALGQVWIFRAISENRMSKDATNQNSLRRAQDITVAKQLSLVVLFNFICWFPVGFVGFLSLSGHEINNDAYAWIVVLVLPVNAAINPLLYTIPVLMDTWEKLKCRKSRR